MGDNKRIGYEKGRTSSKGKEQRTGRASFINGRQQTQRTGERMRKHNEQEMTYVTMTGEGHASNITETKQRGLDWPAVGDIATGAIWWRSVEVPKHRG